jgi:hypothetical protein
MRNSLGALVSRRRAHDRTRRAGKPSRCSLATPSCSRPRLSCEEYCEREVDEAEWQGGWVYLLLGASRDDHQLDFGNAATTTGDGPE